MLNRVVAGLLALSCCHVVFAADTPQYAPPPSWVRPSAGADAPVPADGAALRIMHLEHQYNFDSSGDEEYSADLVRVQTPDGLTALGTLTVPWNPDTDTLTIHRLLIHRGDQTIDVLASGQKFTVLRRENKLEYAALDGILTAVIQPPGLQVDDVLDFAYTLKHSDPVLRGTSEWLESNWPAFPVAHLSIRAGWPSTTHIRWLTSPAFAALAKSRDGDRTIVSLEATNVQPPAFANYIPLRFRVGNELEFTEFQSWGDVAKLLTPLYAQAEALDAKSPLLAEIERIRAASPDPARRAEAALRLVQEQVRYVFLGMNDGGLIPATADSTWARRFGDCKGKTVLLLTLLHGLGISAEPVVVNTQFGDALKTRLPLISVFDHVLVRATIAGKVYWLDGARSGDRSLEKILVPFYHWGLPLTAGSSELVAMVPAPLVDPQGTVSLRVDATAGIDKPAPFHAETILRGDSAQLVRAPLANLTPALLDKDLRDYWAKQYSFVQIQSVSAHFDDQAGTETLLMDGSATLDWRGDRYELDGARLGFDANFTRAAGPDHDLPFMVTYPTFGRMSETILLPDGGKGFALQGDDINRTVAGIHYQRRTTLKGNVVSAEAEMLAVAPEFPAAEADAAQKTLREMWQEGLYVSAPSAATSTSRAASDATPPGPTAAEHVKNGESMAKLEILDGAIAEFTSALSVEPGNLSALRDRGAAYTKQRKFDLARADFSDALLRAPRDTQALGLLVKVDIAQGNFAAAADGLVKVLASKPTDAVTSSDTLQQLGIQYTLLGRYDLALQNFTAALVYTPNRFGLYGWRAEVLRLQGQSELSLAEARAVIHAGEGAADDIKAGSYSMAGQIYAQAGDLVDSALAFDRSITLNATADRLLFRRGNRLTTDEPGRREDVEAALKLDPKSQRATLALADEQMHAADYAGAVDTLTAMLQNVANSPELLNRRGIAYLKSGQSHQANADLSHAQQGAGEGALNNMCWALGTADVELALALNECESALSMVPDDRYPLDSKGLVLLKLGRLDEAIATYDKALKYNPISNSSLFGRGIARRLKGDTGGNADLKLARQIDSRVDDLFKSYGVTP